MKNAEMKKDYTATTIDAVKAIYQRENVQTASQVWGIFMGIQKKNPTFCTKNAIELSEINNQWLEEVALEKATAKIEANRKSQKFAELMDSLLFDGLLYSSLKTLPADKSEKLEKRLFSVFHAVEIFVNRFKAGKLGDVDADDETDTGTADTGTADVVNE